MARISKIVDDIDGSDATDTLEFSWGADNYTIDLNDKNAEVFRDLIALYVAHATKVVPTPPVLRGTTKGRTSAELNRIRDWARENGFEVASMGKIRAEVMEAYDARSTNDDNTEGGE